MRACGRERPRAALGHIDHCRWEYLNEMFFSVVVCSLELGLIQLHSLHTSVSPSIKSIWFFLIEHCWSIDLPVLLSWVKGNRFTNHLKCRGAKMKWLEMCPGTEMGEGRKPERKGEEELSTSSSVLHKAASGGKPWLGINNFNVYTPHPENEFIWVL